MKKILYVCLMCVLFGLPEAMGQQPAIVINEFSMNSGDCVNGVSEIVLIVSLNELEEPASNYTLCVQYDAVNNDTMTCTAITTNPPPGTPIFAVMHTYEVPGSYVVKVYVADNLLQNYLDSVILYTDSFCMNSIQGNVSLDEFNTCAPGIPVMAPVPFRVDRNGVPVDTFHAYSSYSYTFSPNYNDSVYTVTPIELPEGFTMACPGSGSYAFVLDTIGAFYQLDFGLSCPGSGYDLMAYGSGIYKAFGVPSYSGLMIHLNNLSCMAVDAVLTLDIDPRYHFSSASVTPSSINGQTVSWNMQDLEPMEWNSLLYVQLEPDVTAVIDEIACSTVSLGPLDDDLNSANNTFTFCDTIRSSWDPNDKHVQPGGALAPGMELTYTINFENLGNDTAFNVVIRDTISGNLDAGTFKLITSSHPVTVSQQYHNDQKILTFTFPDIQLGDRNQPHTNKGFVTYTFTAKSTIIPGDEISNTAYIYFDNNPAVVTNTVLSKYPDPNVITQVERDEAIKVFPNPASDELFIVWEQGQEVHEVVVLNLLGQVIQKQAIKGRQTRISISSLTSGIYYLKLSGSTSTQTVKFIKN